MKSFSSSAKGADARREAREGTSCSLRGALHTATVLRAFFHQLGRVLLTACLLFISATSGHAQDRAINPFIGNFPSRVSRNLSTTVVPQPLAPSPASGSGLSQTFTFTFSDRNGWQNFAVLDVLINATLDGQNACYFALVPTGPTAGKIYLVPNSGAGAELPSMTLPGTGSLSNSQCTLAATGASVIANSTTVTLTLPITFASAFSGNKAFYLAAQDTSLNDSGWQALATWNVPGGSVTGPAVTGMSPARNTFGSKETYSFTVTDSNGWQDLSVVDVLINSDLDGRQACYFALAVSQTSPGTLYLVGDGLAGDPAYAGVASLPGSGTISNSQCTLSLQGASVIAGGDELILNLPITFSSSFAGNKLFYVAARETNATSDWQVVGSLSIP